MPLNFLVLAAGQVSSKGFKTLGTPAGSHGPFSCSFEGRGGGGGCSIIIGPGPFEGLTWGCWSSFGLRRIQKFYLLVPSSSSSRTT